MVQNNILTEDGLHVKVLTSVQIDSNLPKYRVMAERTNGETDKRNSGSRLTTADGYAPGEREEMKAKMSYDYLKKFVTDKSKDITDFNVTITDTINRVIRDTSLEGFVVGGNNSIAMAQNTPSLWKTIKNYFRDSDTKKGELETEKAAKKFDVIGFFADIHGLIEGEETEAYTDRVSNIIECIGLAEISGQVALKEKLIKALVVNKLESVLYAKGMYKCIDEKVLVELCQKAPKALRLDYLANFTRNIPLEVVRKKLEADKLCVFDNYAVLHYDPDDSGTDKTDEEKEKEIRKKKDPIIFGCISGSNKLYYIADFIDDYCDLTFEKLTEIVGQELIESKFLTNKM